MVKGMKNDTMTKVMQGTLNEDTGNTDDDEVDWVVKSA